MPRSRCSVVGVFALLVMAGGAMPDEALALDAPPRPHLDRHAGRAVDFDEALGIGERAEVRQRMDAAVEGKRRADASLPRMTSNPQLQLMPGGRLPPSADAGFELQATVSQGWNLEGYGRKRTEAARAETEVLAADVRALALERRMGAARAWILLHAAERRLTLAREELAVDQELVAVLARAREAGVATRVDEAEARALVAETEVLITALSGEVHDLGLALGGQVGERGGAPLRTRGDYPDPSLPPESELRDRFADLETLPSVARQRLRARAALAQERSAEANRGTRLTTGLSMQRESNRDVLLFGVVGVSLSVLDRGQHARSAARAEARMHEVEADVRELDLSARLQVAIHDLRHTEQNVVTLRDHTIPALDELVEARDMALGLGEGTRPLLLHARHRRSAADRDLAEAEAEWVWARVEVWLYLQAIESAEAGS